MRNACLIFTFFLFSCANQPESAVIAGEKDAPMKDLKLHGSYYIDQIKNKDVLSERFTLSFDSISMRMAGHAGCNRFGGTFEQTANEIQFSDPVSTKMYCEGKMKTEQEIIEVLQQINEVNISNRNVVFYSANNEKLLSIQKQE